MYYLWFFLFIISILLSALKSKNTIHLYFYILFLLNIWAGKTTAQYKVEIQSKTFRKKHQVEKIARLTLKRARRFKQRFRLWNNIRSVCVSLSLSLCVYVTCTCVSLSLYVSVCPYISLCVCLSILLYVSVCVRVCQKSWFKLCPRVDVSFFQKLDSKLTSFQVVVGLKQQRGLKESKVEVKAWSEKITFVFDECFYLTRAGGSLEIVKI